MADFNYVTPFYNSPVPIPIFLFTDNCPKATLVQNLIKTVKADFVFFPYKNYPGRYNINY